MHLITSTHATSLSQQPAKLTAQGSIRILPRARFQAECCSLTYLGLHRTCTSRRRYILVGGNTQRGISHQPQRTCACDTLARLTMYTSVVDRCEPHNALTAIHRKKTGEAGRNEEKMAACERTKVPDLRTKTRATCHCLQTRVIYNEVPRNSYRNPALAWRSVSSLPTRKTSTIRDAQTRFISQHIDFITKP